MQQKQLRNIAIIAHVDHGKTTLVDAMLKQTKTFAIHQKENQATTIMDSNDLEREKGVTILSKNTAVFWKDYKINILDTPGHADFSGEVERVLNMADGCILLVDAAEGVLSQTRFVLKLALELGLAPVVLINKVDRKDQRIAEVESEVADLFLELATQDSQLDFPTLYARGIDGIVGKEIEEQSDYSVNITDSTDLEPLFETIIDKIPYPVADESAPLQIQVNSLDWDQHKGRIAIGRIFRGTVKKNQPVKVLHTNGKVEAGSVVYLFNHFGLERREVDVASAGEIVAIAGMPDPGIGDTIADTHEPEALPQMDITEPTVKMQLMVNTSPFAGQEAEFSTSRQLQARLKKELETNVGLRMLPGTSGENVMIVGRGELHLAILIETMRREGYEFSLSKPQVVLREEDGQTLEPWEHVTIDITDEYTGTITSTMAKRRGEMKNMHQTKTGVRFEYEISTANLIGYRSELLTTTSGEGVVHNTFLEYRPLTERIVIHRGGAMIAHQTGSVTAYSLEKSQPRGSLFVDPGDKVYAGQVVGINKRSEEMVINVVRGKKLTNMRASSADTTVVLTPAWRPSLEQFLTIVGDNEVLEVTPESLRLRSMIDNKKLAG
ncbi:MAG: translational GTPase TypA [Candidatus Pacebacteria bacterium]|jgi:GTP-binding protein|nr:translational GTPase TypA [Candidatus Paceibacterota bacterium]MBT4651898.1 translational GTPase TypA [Candidatus Paceibacterota bacterium]MBT6755718.1 translational GTPase TypA [Candidatus Paceibacterota bacterium]MBT6921224.1 translational GTPase TypA [Candidatus Paceibacterota bacterium]